jgi:hypothetical protein
MAQVNYPIINGFAHEHNTARFLIRGKEYIGVTSIDYDCELMPGEVYGTRAQMINRTRGKHKATASFEMIKADAQALINDLGDGYGEVRFDIICSFPADPDDDATMITDKIIGARITKPSQNSAEGGEAIKIKFDLSVLDVKFGGVSMVRNSIY